MILFWHLEADPSVGLVCSVPDCPGRVLHSVAVLYLDNDEMAYTPYASCGRPGHDDAVMAMAEKVWLDE